MVETQKVTFKIDRIIYEDLEYFVVDVLSHDKNSIDTLYAYSLNEALRQLKRLYKVDVNTDMRFAERKLDDFLVWYKRLSNRYPSPEEIEKLRDKFPMQ